MRCWLAIVALALCCLACSEARSDHGSTPRRIVYWDKWTDFEGEAMDRVVEAFNAEQRAKARRTPRYRPIEVERVTISRIDQKLLVACAGGNPPDVAGTYSYLVATYADKGALTDLSDRLASAGIEREHYIPHYFDLGVHRGRVWAVPTTPAAVGLHWNKRLFREAGLDPERPPETLEELDQFAERLTKWEVTLPSGETRIESGYLPDVASERKRLIQVGFLPSEPAWWFYGWGFVFGGELMQGERVTTAAPENIAAYEWVASYSRKLGVDAVQRFRSGFGNFASPQNPFLSGQLAMQLQGVWMYNFVRKFADGMLWGAAPFPAPAARPESRGAGTAEADVLVIPTGAAHPDEAFEFIKFVSARENMEQLCLGQRKFSPLKEVSTEFWAQHPHPYIRLFAELGAGPNAYAQPKTGVWNLYLREMNYAVDAIQNLRATPEEALQTVEQRMQLAVDREREIAQRRTR
jgi:ABC-type glycerol-3-phosphate transport system substrate-binding protein